MTEHEPCADCVRCATCRREWCPTVVLRCPGEESIWVHVTGRPGTRDNEYCYRCTVCPGGYFDYYLPEYPNCTEIPQEPHVAFDGRGSN